MPRALIIIGVLIVILGMVLHFAPWLVNWFGKLPGDINIKGEGSRVFIPITSMVIISVILTIIVNLFGR